MTRVVPESKLFHQNIEIAIEMRKIPTTKILDKLHRGVVIACIGLTLYGTGLIGHRVYRYFTVVKPHRETEEFKMLQVMKIFTAS